jgi:hypothetical protein
MQSSVIRIRQDLSVDVQALSRLILGNQLDSGAIPWCRGQKTDPWDHVESAMGLTVGGYPEAARRAYEWMRRSQLADGSWYAAYHGDRPDDLTRDANLSSYIAVGVYHYYLVTGDRGFTAAMWPTVSRAMDFALALQAPEGPIHWAISPKGRVDPMALLTGSSSVYMSLKCALKLAQVVEAAPPPRWRPALLLLEEALRQKRHLFNMTKSRFSMDWFYPILTGALTGEEARKRIDTYWKKFVVEGQGVRCVYDEPWVTIAETCELILALVAMGNDALARIVFSWISSKRFDDDTFWCGFTFPDMVIWPEDKITWTNAVVLMALDALYQLTPASQLFHHAAWERRALA